MVGRVGAALEDKREYQQMSVRGKEGESMAVTSWLSDNGGGYTHHFG